MTPPPPRRDPSSPPSGRRPAPAVVACGLLALVLLLSLAAYLGVRAWLGDAEGEEQGSLPQHEVVAAALRVDAG